MSGYLEMKAQAILEMLRENDDDFVLVSRRLSIPEYEVKCLYQQYKESKMETNYAQHA